MKKLIVLTGAGISADSGLQTFRDAGGLWEGYSLEIIREISLIFIYVKGFELKNN